MWFIEVLTWQKFDNPFQFFLEPNVQDSISLVDDEALQILVKEVFRVLEMIKQTTRSGNQDVDAWK